MFMDPEETQFERTNREILDEIESNTFQDRAYGCILGSFIADSIGSYVEFSNDIVSEDDLDGCMEMNGGGPFRIGPGQVTDDSE